MNLGLVRLEQIPSALVSVAVQHGEYGGASRLRRSCTTMCTVVSAELEHMTNQVLAAKDSTPVGKQHAVSAGKVGEFRVVHTLLSYFPPKPYDANPKSGS